MAELNELCARSLEETLANFKASENDSLLKLSIEDLGQLKRSHKSHIERPLSTFEAQLKTSYIPRDSFALNKVEPMASKRRSGLLLLSNLMSQQLTL